MSKIHDGFHPGNFFPIEMNKLSARAQKKIEASKAADYNEQLQNVFCQKLLRRSRLCIRKETDLHMTSESCYDLFHFQEFVA